MFAFLGVFVALFGIGNLCTKQGRQNYLKNSSNYYRRRYWYFKKNVYGF